LNVYRAPPRESFIIGACCLTAAAAAVAAFQQPRLGWDRRQWQLFNDLARLSSCRPAWPDSPRVVIAMFSFACLEARCVEHHGHYSEASRSANVCILSRRRRRLQRCLRVACHAKVHRSSLGCGHWPSGQQTVRHPRVLGLRLKASSLNVTCVCTICLGSYVVSEVSWACA